MHAFIVLQYSNGIGHLARCSAIAAALSERSRVTLFSGGRPVDGYAPPPSVGLVQLPPMRWERSEGAGAVPVDPAVATEDAHRGRGMILVDAFLRERPEIIIIEYYPFVPARFGQTLTPLLEAASSVRPKPLVVCSLRTYPRLTFMDRGDDPGWINRELRSRFDCVLHHADPVLFPLGAMDPFVDAALRGVPVIQTGFVRKALTTGGWQRESIGLLLTVGGGSTFGAHLLKRWIAACRRLLRRPAPVHALCGPLMDPRDRQSVQREQGDGVVVHGAVADLDPLLLASRAVVCMGGYNTLVEALSLGKRVLAFPSGRDEDQHFQINRLATRGLLLEGDPEWDEVRMAQAFETLIGFEPRSKLAAEGALRSVDAIFEALDGLRRPA